MPVQYEPSGRRRFCPAENRSRAGSVHAEGIERQHAFSRLGRRHPITGGDAAHAEALHDEGGPPFGDAAAAGLALERSRQHRVVPVHGEFDLGGEGTRVMRHGVPEPPSRQLPVRAVLGQALGDGHGAPHGVVDRRRAGEQCVPLGAAGRVERPQHRAVRLLRTQDEVDPLLDRRPELAEELHVAGDQMMVPGTGRQVGADVGVEPEVLDPVALVVVEPAAVRELAPCQPPVGVDGLVHQAAHGQRHGRLDVVPGVAVAALEPRDLPVVALHRRDGVAGGEDVGTRQDAGHLRQRGGTDLFCGHAAAPWLGVVGPRRPGTPRGSVGRESGRSATLATGLLR